MRSFFEKKGGMIASSGLSPLRNLSSLSLLHPGIRKSRRKGWPPSGRWTERIPYPCSEGRSRMIVSRIRSGISVCTVSWKAEFDTSTERFPPKDGSRSAMGISSAGLPNGKRVLVPAMESTGRWSVWIRRGMDRSGGGGSSSGRSCWRTRRNARSSSAAGCGRTRSPCRSHRPCRRPLPATSSSFDEHRAAAPRRAGTARRRCGARGSGGDLRRLRGRTPAWAKAQRRRPPATGGSRARRAERGRSRGGRGSRSAGPWRCRGSWRCRRCRGRCAPAAPSPSPSGTRRRTGAEEAR